VPELHQFRLDPTDAASGDRMSQLLSAELDQERTTMRRRRWMGVVAAASVPTGLGALFPRLIAPDLQHAALAIWGGALVVTCAWSVEEWRSQRRLRALLTARR
jgi:hypothetical protein